MGGTSADVGLVRDGRPAVTTARKVAGWPCLFPMLDIETVGAGGGSVAWVDAGGLLKVGPRSAGAEPGPAAYGRGGEEPTVTDADVVLGRLGPEGLAGGRVPLDPERARRALWDGVARRLGLSLEEAAWGVLAVAGATMESAVRLMTIERGLDPRDFSLVAFGGAGPLHAVALARALGMPRVIVPPDPGTFSARGLLAAEVRTDAVKTLLLRLEPGRCGRGAAARCVLECAAALAEEVAGVLEEEGVPPRSAEVRTVVDLRYEGQNHEIRVVSGRLGSEDDIARAVRLFHRCHHELNGFRLERAAVEVVNVRVEGTGRLPGSGLPRVRRSPAPASPGAAAPGSRPVYFGPRSGWLTTPVVGRKALEPGRWHPGPFVVAEPDATTLVPPGTRVRLVADGAWAGSLVIEPGAGEGAGGDGGGDGDG
jgi:N-methylhydantoinase A